jgi:hypothetical protein
MDPPDHQPSTSRRIDADMIAAHDDGRGLL